MCPLVCTTARLLPPGLRGGFARAAAPFVAQRVEFSELLRHAATQARPGLAWRRDHDAPPPREAGEEEAHLARVLHARGVRIGDELRVDARSLGSAPLHGVTHVALPTREVFAPAEPWRRPGRAAVEAAARRARGDLRQLAIGVALPDAGALDATWTPLDATCHLLYGTLDLAEAERTLAQFDNASFMMGMLHQNYVGAVLNENAAGVEAIVEAIGAAADLLCAADALRAGYARAVLGEGIVLLSRCAAASGRKAARPRARVQWADERARPPPRDAARDVPAALGGPSLL